jgi:hypothetical protein
MRACFEPQLLSATAPRFIVIPGRAKREPGIHYHDPEYGFRDLRANESRRINRTRRSNI